MKKRTKKNIKSPCKSITTSLRQRIQDEYPDIELLFMSEKEFDRAIIGVVEGICRVPVVAYDYDKVLKVNMNMGMSYVEAIEYFEYNQIGAYMGEHTPVFIRRYN